MLLLCSTTFPLVYGQTASADFIRSVMDRPADGLSFLDGQMKLNTRQDAEEVARSIEACPRLIYLELRGNTLGIEAGERISEAIQKHPELTHALWSDLFTGRLKTEIPIIVRGMCTAMMRSGACLTELDLSDNAFGPIGAESIQEFLVSPSAVNLKALRLNNCGMGSGGVTIANCLLTAHRNAAAAGKKFALKTFVAGRNRLEDPGATALSKAFKEIGTLEEITIHQNGIRRAGIQAMAGCLAYNKNLRVISFNDNTCTRKGALAIAFALGDLQKLEVLDLGDCLCRANGTTAILSVLVSKPFPALERVILDGNELPSRVVQDVLGAWTNRIKKAKLSLSCNGFGSNFGELIEEILDRGMEGLVDIGEESDDEGTADEESEREEEEESDDEEEERKSEESGEKGAGDTLASALAGLGVQQQPVAAAATPAAPAASAAAGPYELSFLDQQQKWESEADAEPVYAALRAHPEVTSFVLRGNTLGIGAGERIAQALEHCPKMRECNWSDLFTGRLRSEIPIIVKRLCAAMIKAGVQLRSLDLSDNAFGPIGAESIQEFLESDSAFSLEELRLNNCGLGAGAVTVANSLLTLHKRATAAGRKLNLRVIVAGRNRLEIPGALAFAKAIGEIGTLEELTVHQNGIHRPGMIGLAEGVAKNPRMKALCVADNVGGWEGALAFAKALPNLRQLESADFSDCLSKNKGCTALVQAAARLPVLKSLNISGSELTAPVAVGLVKVWSQCKGDGAVLNISTNNFSDEFGNLRTLAKQLGGKVDVGESDDDCGSGSEDEDDGEEDEQAEAGDDTSDGEKNSQPDTEEEEEGEIAEEDYEDEEDYDEDDYYDEEEEEYEESDEEKGEAVLERSGDSAKENAGPAAPILTRSLIASFIASPTGEGLKTLAMGGQTERVRREMESFASARDQTESARLFLAVWRVATISPSLEPEAVKVLDMLVTEVAKHPRKPIPTIVQLMNHLAAHVDDKLKCEEELIDRGSIGRLMGERLIGQLMARGRLGEARVMIGHYFPSAVAGAAPAAAAAAAPKQTFSFSFGGNSANPPPKAAIIPKFSFGK